MESILCASPGKHWGGQHVGAGFIPIGGAWTETHSWVHGVAGGQQDEGEPPSHLSRDNFQWDNTLGVFGGVVWCDHPSLGGEHPSLGVCIPVWGPASQPQGEHPSFRVSIPLWGLAFQFGSEHLGLGLSIPI